MADLIACIGTGKGTWAHVLRIIDEQEWGTIFIVTNAFGQENFKCRKDVSYIVIDEEQQLPDLIQSLKAQLSGKIGFGDIAINFISGTGKEHMALLSACLQLGVGIRLIALTKNGIQEV